MWGQGRGNNRESQTKEVNVKDPMDNRGICEFLDPVLGINLVGREYHTGSKYKNESGNLENSSMEHDLEDDVIVREEGKKRNRRDMEDVLAKEKTNVLAERSKRTVEVNHKLSAAVKWAADRSQ
ncbi:hypothetical protein V6Z11_D12G163800 [Gossypium hirsutum]